MIETTMNGTDSSSSSGTAPSISGIPDRAHELHEMRKRLSVMDEETVQAMVRSRFKECKIWLKEHGCTVDALTFDDMHEELELDHGSQDRAMLYRGFAYEHSHLELGRVLQVPTHIGESAVVRGHLGTGGASVWYCKANIQALRSTMAGFVADIVDLPNIEHRQERMQQYSSIVKQNIDDLERSGARLATKVFPISPLIIDGEDMEDVSSQRAAREVRRMLVDPKHPIASALPHVVGGRLRGNEWYFHSIYKPGVDLKTLIHAAKEKLPWRVIADLCAQLARLTRLFDHSGMEHGDTKPKNVLVGEHALNILDFGTTKRIQNETADLTTGVHGTFEFISPEKAAMAKTTSQSDVFSTGLVMLAVAKADAPTLYPQGFANRRNRPETATHRALKYKMWMERSEADKGWDARQEWMNNVEIYLPDHLQEEAANDPRLDRYLEDWKRKVWSMLHPLPDMRPSPTSVFTDFVSASRYAVDPKEFFESGYIQKQFAKPMTITDPMDPHPFLAKLIEESYSPQNLRRPHGHDVLEDFSLSLPLIREQRRHTRRGAKKTILAVGTAAAVLAGAYYATRDHGEKEQPQAKHPAAQPGVQKEKDVDIDAHLLDRDLHQPTIIVREAKGSQSLPGYEDVSVPIDHAIEFSEGALLSHEGHPRGFKLKTPHSFTRASVTYSIDHVRSDPSQETTMMLLNLQKEATERQDLQQLFPEISQKINESAEVNVFLFCHGSDHLLLLPGGCGFLVREQDGDVSSQRFTTGNAGKEVRDLCTALLQTEFNGYVVPAPSSKNIKIESLLRDQKRHADSVLMQYLRSSQ